MPTACWGVRRHVSSSAPGGSGGQQQHEQQSQQQATAGGAGGLQGGAISLAAQVNAFQREQQRKRQLSYRVRKGASFALHLIRGEMEADHSPFKSNLSPDGTIQVRDAIQAKRRGTATTPRRRRKSSIDGLGGISSELGALVGTLREGAAFGEQSFLTSAKSKASIRTVEYCEIMSLHRSHLESVFTLSDDDHINGLRSQVKGFLERQQVCAQPRRAACMRVVTLPHEESRAVRNLS